MKRLLLLLMVVFLFITCKDTYQVRNLNTISIKTYKLDSLNIRAIKVIDKDEVHYAAANGDLGYLKNNDIFTSIAPKYDTIIPNYRSIAYNGKDFFALGIGNPALLYKYNLDGSLQLVYKEEHENVFYDAMTFSENGLFGIAIGDPTEDCASIIITKDGGNTWNKLSCNKLPKYANGEAFFAASNTNVKLINKTIWIASGGIKSRILKSTNLGETWKIYETPIIQGTEFQGIYSMDFYNENLGIIIGGDFSKAKENSLNKAITKDGGLTWAIVSDNKNPNYKSCVQYVPGSKGLEIFAVGKTGVSFSNDGGRTWKDISDDAYYTIKFADNNIAWLSGDQKIGKLTIQ